MAGFLVYTVAVNKIDSIETISDKLAETTMAVAPKRCLYIRNWNSRCRACLNTCPHDSIERSLGHLEIDSETCTNCGACVAACPTSTMFTTAPTAGEIVKEARLSAHAVFACAPLADKEEIDTAKVVILPCLSYLDEYLLCGLFALGIQSANLLHGPCGQCETDPSGTPVIETTVAHVKQLLKLWAVDARVRLVDKIPKQVRPSRKAGVRDLISGTGRRDAFRQAGGSVMGFVAQAVNDTMDEIAGTKPIVQKRKQITVRIEEVFPPETYRSVRLLKMLDRLGTRPRGTFIETPFWANVDIDPSKCRHCGMCSKMCVTRALMFTEDEEAHTGTLTFMPSLCIGCRLCKDTCFTHSMVYSNKVLADDLDASVTKTLFENAEQRRPGRNFLR